MNQLENENFEPINLKNHDKANRYDLLLISNFSLDLKILWSYLKQNWMVFLLRFLDIIFFLG